ncbi:unnamed protein product [Pieris macdunnoughi]|uniref:Peptidase S1 domain-containing protein n=1 Tax=Pieris macdunnoughi TaxID=345717 RepID=A0A821MLC1_9NEOP|nr:unnamed protein product [Pieris macdunnoughi]
MEYGALVFIIFIGNSIGKVPWIGILKVNLGKVDAGTGIVLIKENVAIAVSNEVSKLSDDLRLSARIYFYNHGLSTCYIIDMKTHPEYYKNVLNTITLIFVKCLSKLWTYIRWPQENMVYDRNLFAIGLIDNKAGFSQISYNVDRVNKNNCEQFYLNEELDYHSLWPRNIICVKAAMKKQCVFEAGMPLVHKNGPIWTLVGISTLGPGCSLPSRFILLSPYVPWIERNLFTFTSRRNKELNKNVTVTEDRFLSETIDKEDDFVISKFSDSSMVMRTNLSNVVDKHGECTNIDGEIMYRDEGRVEASGYTATGTYALSLYDTYYNKITCVMIRVSCSKRTPSKLWYDTGFHQEHIDQLLKTVPIFKWNQTVPPKIVYKIDSYAKHEKYSTVNVIFKFEFTNKARIFVDFYARRSTTTMIPIPDYMD